MTTVLIDGDVVLYEVTTACEIPTDWGNDVWTLHSDFSEAKQRFDNWVLNIQKILEADKVIIALSGTENWRKDVLPTYKLHRKKTRKPLAFSPLKDYAEEIYKTYKYDNLEGDDVMGILAGDPKIKGEKIMVTIDKDLKTIPGNHYNPLRKEEGIVEVSQEQADYNHLFQSLTGDTVDGYSGCPGIGPKRAARVLAYPCWGAVIEAYETAGLTEEDALVQARVARILRYGEYNTKTKEVKLWQPLTAKSS